MLSTIPIFMPDEVDGDEEMMKVIARGGSGLCMLCTKPLGKDTLLVIGADGIRMVFCSGACLSDQQTVGFLEELHDDIVEQIKFRGTEQGDQPEPEGDPSDPRE
jgi:hypothetical protein